MSRHDRIAARARALMLAAFGTLLLSGLGGCAVHGRFSGYGGSHCGAEFLEALEFIAWCAVYFGAHWAQGCH
jgi:hypothetical protein